MEYPERPRMFVLRAIEQMLAEGLAAAAGHDVFTLLVVVAKAEDQGGYAGPVEFFNDRLVMLAGLRSVGHLRRVRDVAIKRGWLSYAEGGKGRAGKYFVIDRHGNGLGPEPHSKPDDKPHKKAHSKPHKKLTRNLTHSISPNPSPDPNTETSSLRSEVSCGEPLVAASPPDDVFLTYECNGPAKEWTLTAAKVAEYQQSFPGIDVPAECRKAWQWGRDNPDRRKTARGMARFLGTWLGRAQDRAGRPAAGGGPYLSRGERVAERINAAQMDLFTDLLGGTHVDRPDGQDDQGWGDGADPLALPPRGGAGPDEGVPG